jgi:hypothetical protein
MKKAKQNSSRSSKDETQQAGTRKERMIQSQRSSRLGATLTPDPCLDRPASCLSAKATQHKGSPKPAPHMSSGVRFAFAFTCACFCFTAEWVLLQMHPKVRRGRHFWCSEARCICEQATTLRTGKMTSHVYKHLSARPQERAWILWGGSAAWPDQLFPVDTFICCLAHTHLD